MKTRVIAVLGLLACAMMFGDLTLTASATDYTAPIEHTVTVPVNNLNGYMMTITSGKKFAWTVNVQSGSNLDVLLIDEKYYDAAKMGQSFYYFILYSAFNTRSTSNSVGAQGNYVLIVFVNITASSSSTYNIKVTMSGSTVDSSAALFAIVMVVVIVVVLVVVFVLLKRKKTGDMYQYQFQQPIIQPSLCPKCGSAMRMIPQYHQWYCDQCRSYMLRPATVPQFQPPRY